MNNYGVNFDEYAATLKDYPGALTCKIKALETRENDPLNPHNENSTLYWQIASYAEFLVGNYAIARKYYGLLQKEYPQDRRNFAADLAIKRMNSIEAEFRKGAISNAGSSYVKTLLHGK